jgi:peptide/nickel transport system ATP-binding protein
MRLPVPDPASLKIRRARGLCEKEERPVWDLAEGHFVKCHMSDEKLDLVVPVIGMVAE